MRGRHILRIGLPGIVLAGLLAFGSGGAAQAQDWITPETCKVDVVAVDSAFMPPADQQAIRESSAAMANGTGRLWRITSPDGKVSHLWGTLHSSDRLILDLPPELARLFANARVLALEYLPLAQSRTVLEERALQAGVWLAPTDPPYAKTYLDPRVLTWVTDRVAALAQDPAALSALTDMGLASLLLSDPCEDFAAGVLPIQDFRLLLVAYEAGVPVAGLEHWDAFLTEISQPERQPAARAIAEIYGSYLNPEGFSAARATAMALYRQGRIGEMIAWNHLYLERFFGTARSVELNALSEGYLLEERNRNFLRAALIPAQFLQR